MKLIDKWIDLEINLANQNKVNSKNINKYTKYRNQYRRHL